MRGFNTTQATVTPSPQPSPLREREPVGVRRKAKNSQQRPITLLIAALGGEGGGVLTSWIVSAAESSASRCSRRRSPASRSAPARPPTTSSSCRRRRATAPPSRILALAPGVGDVDVMMASELMEAGRAGRRRLRHGGPHAVDRVDLALPGDGREDRDGRRPLRLRPSRQGDRGELQSAHPDRHGRDRAAHRRVHQFGHARHHRRQRPAADPDECLRSRDPRRRQGRRRKSARVPRRIGGGADARCCERCRHQRYARDGSPRV